jgi:transcriptional regulator with XRE-family HTH domain
MSESFGAMLRRLRLATVWSARVQRHLLGTRWDPAGHLSTTGLARLARIDAGYVHHLETGRKHPSRDVTERLAAALACSETERARLLVSAGYWPWPDTDDATQTVLVALALAVIDGDLRPLEQSVRESCTTGVR